MQLYSRWQNSAGERVRIVLHLKGLEYDYVAVGSLCSGEYQAINPQGLLPALRVGRHVIAQSTAILEYLEEMHPRRPLLPADPILRAQVRAFAQLIASDLHPINNNRVRKYLGAQLGASQASVQAWYEHWIGVAFTALEAALAARSVDWPFCFGDAPGWADLHLAPQVNLANQSGLMVEEVPQSSTVPCA